MITSFNCHTCGNFDKSKATHYDGMLGYSAVICNCCGTKYDFAGVHPLDPESKKEDSQWAKKFITEQEPHVGVIQNHKTNQPRFILNNIDVKFLDEQRKALREIISHIDSFENELAGIESLLDAISDAAYYFNEK